MLIVRRGAAVLLEKRPPSGIWGGLWSLPEASGELELAARAAALGHVAPPHAFTALAPLTHVFTHFKLEIGPRLLEVPEDPLPGGFQAPGARGVAFLAVDGTSAWVPLASLDAYGLPAPVRRLLDALTGSLL
jgi:A/G-specific adenine glycosylase